MKKVRGWGGGGGGGGGWGLDCLPFSPVSDVITLIKTPVPYKDRIRPTEIRRRILGLRLSLRAGMRLSALPPAGRDREGGGGGED